MKKKTDIVVMIAFNVFIFILFSFVGAFASEASYGRNFMIPENVTQTIDIALYGNSSHPGAANYLTNLENTGVNGTLEMSDLQSRDEDPGVFDIIEGYFPVSKVVQFFRLLVISQIPALTLHKFFVTPYNSNLGQFFGLLLIWCYQFVIVVLWMKIIFRDRLAND